jgi:hypothetical protein
VDRSVERGGADIDVSTTEDDEVRRRELERRIEDLEARDESAFGNFTQFDWAVCIVAGVALPLLLIWWNAP